MTYIYTHNMRTGRHRHLCGTFHELYDGPSFDSHIIVTEDGKTIRWEGKVHKMDLYYINQGAERMLGTIKYIKDNDGNIFPHENQMDSGRYYPYIQGCSPSTEQVAEMIRGWENDIQAGRKAIV